MCGEPKQLPSEEAHLGRRDLLAAGILAAVLLVTAAGRMSIGVCGQCHDDAIYVVTAKALAEGEGYHLISLPGAPAQTKYPPLYPALLALVWRAWPDFPANLLALQGLSLLCGCAALALFYLFAVRFGYCRRGKALAAGLLCATSVPYLFFASLTLSEMTFALLVTAALWWLEAALRRPASRPGADFLGGLLLALPFLCRSAGLLFVLVGLLLLWQKGQRWRWTAAGAFLAVLPWLLWSTGAWRSWSRDPVEGYYTDYLGWWLSFGPPALVRVITANFWWVVAGISSTGLDGLAQPLKASAPGWVWFLAFVPFGLLALAALLADVRRGRILPTCLTAYLVLIIVWPWAPHRFLIPVLPFLVVYLLRGLTWVGRFPGLRRLCPALGWGLLGLGLAANLAGWAGQVRIRVQEHTPNAELPPPTGDTGEGRHSWECDERLFAWLREHSESDDLIAAGADPMIALYTGRLAYYPIVCPPLMLFYNLEAPRERLYADALRVLERRRPRYLVLTPNFHGEAEVVRPWVKALRERFPTRVMPVYRDPEDDRFEIFELRYPLRAD